MTNITSLNLVKEKDYLFLENTTRRLFERGTVFAKEKGLGEIKITSSRGEPTDDRNLHLEGIVNGTHGGKLILMANEIEASLIFLKSNGGNSSKYGIPGKAGEVKIATLVPYKMDFDHYYEFEYNVGAGGVNRGRTFGKKEEGSVEKDVFQRTLISIKEIMSQVRKEAI